MTNKEVKDAVARSTEELNELYKSVEQEFQNRKLFRSSSPKFSFKDIYLEKVKKHLV
jgi:hypothetical protein